ALLFEVGLVVLIPIVFTMAKRMNVSQLKIGMPMVIEVSVTHGFLPPHTGAVVIDKELGAHIGEVVLYGLIVEIPVTIKAGTVLAKIGKRLTTTGLQREGD
ncbi:gluconate permease, partial [Staphylococcus pseudintermedius]|uniref:GntT/GntP/DsdX family permease n=1 Tax=Staphylococcus pseudintermedius TaxID=283734 RepID=UPI000E38CA53